MKKKTYKKRDLLIIGTKTVGLALKSWHKTHMAQRKDTCKNDSTGKAE